jgi:hypothetical protein
MLCLSVAEQKEEKMYIIKRLGKYYVEIKRPIVETINTIKSYYRKVRYIIADTPNFCKDLFSLKCNQLTLRDCVVKNFAIHYIDINSRNADKIYKEALAKGDSATAKEYMYI